MHWRKGRLWWIQQLSHIFREERLWEIQVILLLQISHPWIIPFQIKEPLLLLFLLPCNCWITLTQGECALARSLQARLERLTKLFFLAERIPRPPSFFCMVIVPHFIRWSFLEVEVVPYKKLR